MVRRLLLALSTHRGIGDAMARLPVTDRLVRRFVAGRDALDALRVVADVAGRGASAAVTYLGEHVRTPDDAARAASVYCSLVDELARRALPAEPSVKLTQLGLDLGIEVCHANVVRVLERAAAADRRVWIDMEGSAYTDRTLELHAELRPSFPNVACVVQAYLKRTAADVERLLGLGAAVRLCKGAYREPATIAFTTRGEIDASYARLVDRLLAPDALSAGVYPGFATHDPRLQAHVRAVAATRHVPPDRFEIQMLYGVRADLRPGIQAAGLRLRLHVPFGEEWYGYFVRRLAERPANLLFLLPGLARATASTR